MVESTHRLYTQVAVTLIFPIMDIITHRLILTPYILFATQFDARKVDTNSDFSTMRKERSFSYEDEVDLAKGSSEENDKIVKLLYLLYWIL